MKSGRAAAMALGLVVIMAAGCSGSDDTAGTPVASTAASVVGAAADTTPLDTTDTDPAPATSAPPAEEPIGLPPDKEALIEALPVDADCHEDEAASAPAPGAGETVLVVMVAQDGCLRAELMVVPSSEVEARAEEARARPEVVAADVATGSAPASVAPMQASIDPPIEEQQWWLDWLHVGDLDAAVNDAAPYVRVGVVDDGIGEHPDLDPLVVARRPGEPGPTDDHGTHVAGIIGAVPDNGQFGRGVARAVRLLDAPAPLALDPFANRIRWAAANGARVINMSVVETDLDSGETLTGSNATTVAAIRFARHRGAVLVAAVGNCGDQNGLRPANWDHQCHRRQDAVVYPAGYPDVVGVGSHGKPTATGAGGAVSTFSSENGTVDLLAPGEDITSTTHRGTVANSEPHPDLLPQDGTSQAAPMVAGAVAALLSHRPDVTSDQVVEALVATATREAGERTVGAGRIDAAAALEWLDASIPVPATTLEALQGSLVPSLCGHPAGRLVAGTMPGIAPTSGGVWMDGRLPVAVGDVSGDGTPEAAVVVACNQGGVSWPDHIVVYTAGNVLVGAIDLAALTEGAARGTASSLTYTAGAFDVTWLANQPGDLDCCPTRPVRVSLRIDDDRVLRAGDVVDDDPTGFDETSCEGVDMTPVTELGAFAGLDGSTCAAPWGLVAFSEAAPSVSAALIRYDDAGHTEVVTSWTHLETGANPDYTAASIAGYGVPLETATAMFERLGGPSAGNDPAECTTQAFARGTGVTTETANCEGVWGVGVPVDCGDQCEAVEVFELQSGRWVSRGATHSACPDAATSTGMPIAVARELIPDACGDADTATPSATGAQVLREGDRGDAVAALQRALVAAGFPVEVDGAFGPGTEAAVTAFQRQAGLEPDGLAGPATRRALGLP